MNVRGERRLAVLREAAGALLADEGFDALTHRALSARSGVPVASTTHYFRNIDDLVLAAADQLASSRLERARTLVDAQPRRRTSAAAAARLVAQVVLGSSPTGSELTSTLERYVQAARAPALRPLVADWNAQLRDLVAEALSRCGRTATPARAGLLIAAVDGLTLAALAEGAEDPVAAVTRPLARLLADAPQSR